MYGILLLVTLATRMMVEETFVFPLSILAIPDTKTTEEEMSVFRALTLAIQGIKTMVEVLLDVLRTTLLVIQDIKMMEGEINASLDHYLVTLDIKMMEEEIKTVLLWLQIAIQDTKTMVKEMFVFSKLLHVIQVIKMTEGETNVYFKAYLAILVTKTMVVSLKNVSF